MKRKAMVVTVVLVVVMLVFAGCSNTATEEKEFPTGIIEIVVPAGAGGGSDNFARAIAMELSDIFGVTVNIVNMPGGNEMIGLEEVLKRPGDGYTLMTTTSTHVLEQAQGKRENPEAIEGISLFHEDTYAIHVKEGGEFNTIEDFIAAAKANPGQIRVGGTYSLALDEIVIRKFEKAAGIELNYVPYDETGKFQADVLGGHIEAIIDEFPPEIELIRGGEVKPILVFAEERIEMFSEVPTSVEKGWDVTDGQLRGFLIKTDTPQEIKDVLENALKQAYETERYQEFSADRLLNLKEVFAGADGYNALMDKQLGEYKVIYENLK